jgi:hypothetical protein
MDPDPTPFFSDLNHQAKIVRKTLIPAVFLLLFDFLSLKNDVNVVWSAQVKHERGGMLGRVNLGLSGHPSIIYQYFFSSFFLLYVYSGRFFTDVTVNLFTTKKKKILF